jgi:ATP synthase protein I
MLENGVLAMTANDKNDKREAFAALTTYGTLGIEMGVSLAIGLGIGYALDHWLGTSPVFTIIFMIFGLVAGMRRIYALWKRIEREDERDNSK